MAGTKAGAAKAAKTNKERHGDDFYAKIGQEGGTRRNPNKGFGSATPEQRSEWGRKGGAKSKRLSASNQNEENQGEDR